VTVFEASDDVGGQWHATAAHGGVWPRMRTNTSRTMTAFSDFDAPADLPLHPADQRAADRVRSRARHGRGRGLPQAALRDPEGRRWRFVGLAVVHGVRARSRSALV
jgi:cation diffusion facilitator CzcD-associated flavoprotein CzcO